ncbi:MAG TPA: ATP-binding SpoIIE family protein phosphatase [Opitutaceae bacterium]
MAAAPLPEPQSIFVSDLSDIGRAQRVAKEMATALGFDELRGEEIVLAASELASNLIRHARRGTLTMTPVTDAGRIGMQVESLDSGPGIADVEQALTDGFSTGSGLGYGLGAVNRLMDTLDISSQQGAEGGTRVTCTRWLRSEMTGLSPCPLDFGAATRAYPGMQDNGDAFVIKRWGAGALVALVDGLGHGNLAHRAAQAARQYVENHFDQSLADLFRGVGRACHGTRGVVMAIGLFDWAQERLTFASIGNVEARVHGKGKPPNFLIRRGIVGVNAVSPVVTEHPWDRNNTLVLHSDGLRTHWQWEDFPDLASMSASIAAQRLLHALAKDDDDATILVVKGRTTIDHRDQP